MPSPTERIQELQAYHAALMQDKQHWDVDAAQLSKHFLPRRSRFLEGKDQDLTNKGMLRTDVLDGAGIRARRTATAGMHSGMTSPARPWFRLTLQDEELAKRASVRLWLDEVQKRMRNVFARSNFYQSIHSLYDEMITFGTNPMFEHAHDRAGITFDSLSFGEYCIDTNERGVVDTIFRTMEMTARAIVRMFGYEKCSPAVKSAYDNVSTRLNRFPVIHVVLPREDRDPSVLTNTNMAFASIYYEKGSRSQFLRESGYSMFPAIVPRWDVTGQDVYGNSPCMDSLGDIRMLQSMWFTYLKQEQKRADPPMIAPENIKTLPGKINIIKTTGGAGDKMVYPAYQTVPDPQGILLIIQDVRQSIREGLYNDLFKMIALAPDRPQMTATEVAERHEEKLLQLGPVLERLHSEGFTPLIDRTFYLMLEQDMIPPWPEELDGTPLKVDFISLLAQAQKLVATGSVDRYMGFIGAYGEMFPELTDIPDTDKMGDEYADYLGLPANMIRPQEDREVRRKQRQQAIEAEQQAAVAASGAQTAKTLADTPMRGGDTSALDEVINGRGI